MRWWWWWWSSGVLAERVWKKASLRKEEFECHFWIDGVVEGSEADKWPPRKWKEGKERKREEPKKEWFVFWHELMLMALAFDWKTINLKGSCCLAGFLSVLIFSNIYPIIQNVYIESEVFNNLYFFLVNNNLYFTYAWQVVFWLNLWYKGCVFENKMDSISWIHYLYIINLIRKSLDMHEIVK